jgi:hypothetical protein
VVVVWGWGRGGVWRCGGEGGEQPGNRRLQEAGRIAPAADERAS